MRRRVIGGEQVGTDVAGDVEVGRQLVAVLVGVVLLVDVVLVRHGLHGSAGVGQPGQTARSFS